MSASSSTRVVLLVEDNPADANIVCEMMADKGGERERYDYKVVSVTRMTDAIARLQSGDVDVILLDLGLPDFTGLDAIARVREVAGGTPIVVLTGTDDELLATRCIDFGAQDYLSKHEIRPISLRRAINYAIARSLESEINALKQALERYRDLSSTPAAGGRARERAEDVLKERHAATFAELVDAYVDLLRRSFDRLVVRAEKPREAMERLADRLGNAGATPRDLIDLHIAALNRSIKEATGIKARAMAIEGRLVALEMMGLLVDYYRLGRAVEQGR